MDKKEKRISHSSLERTWKDVKMGACVCTYVHKHTYTSFCTWTCMSFEEVQLVLGGELYTYRTPMVGKKIKKRLGKTQQLD